MGADGSPQTRIASLDQFRGYTVLGMFVVNFLGSYAVTPALLRHHHTYCSYADTIMPHFFLAVGFAYRLTLRRRLEGEGRWAAYGRVLRRNLGLILLGVVFYHLDGRVQTWAELQRPGLWGFLTTAFQRSPFQTLVHIGITSLWVLPVIAARPAVRIGFAVLSGALHVGLSYGFYYDWVMTRPCIDGGQLGFLTWTIPLLAGSLACDAVTGGAGSPVGRLLAWGTGLMVLGYALSCLNLVTPPVTNYEQARRHEWEQGHPETPAHGGVPLVEPPFVPPSRPVNLWTMSQRAGSLSYHTFAAGLSLAVYTLFVLACDFRRWRLGLLTTLGSNALAAYLIHELVAEAVKPYAPRDAPLWYVLAAFAVFFAVCYLFLRHLAKKGLFLRL